MSSFIAHICRLMGKDKHMISVTIVTDHGTTIYDVMEQDAKKVERQIARMMDNIITDRKFIEK